MSHLTSLEKDILAADKKYAAHFHKSSLTEEAKRHVAILTCMDARLNIDAFTGLKLGDAYILRNAGGRASDDMIRSLVLATRLFAVDEYFVVHHTDCGLEKVSDPEMRELLQKNLGPCKLHEKCPKAPDNRDRYRESDYVAFLAFEDLEKSVIDDVVRIRSNPLVSKHVTIHGYIYDVDSGELHPVRAANEKGKPIPEDEGHYHCKH